MSLISRKVAGDDVETSSSSQIVEQFPDLRKENVRSRLVTVPAGVVVRVPVDAPGGVRGVRMLTALDDLSVAVGEFPEALGSAGANVLDYVTASGSDWAPANGLYGPFPVVPITGDRVFKVGEEGGRKYFQWDGTDWVVYLDYQGSDIDPQLEYRQDAGNADPTAELFGAEGEIGGTEMSAAQLSVRSTSASSTGSRLAANEWEVRVIEPSADLRFFSTTGGTVEVETF